MAPIFRCFRGSGWEKSKVYKNRKVDLHRSYISVFSGDQGAKIRKSDSHEPYFSVFSGVRVRKAESRRAPGSSGELLGALASSWELWRAPGSSGDLLGALAISWELWRTPGSSGVLLGALASRVGPRQ